ncbi:hypothetical protein M441DRAFT_207820 [Trichoderma asperellum CBS 433.97]|uniref:Uncharacterized protein n=1 Tax=Trichoderma asperellum (strain ATCC 204424 / CBS 433.97 / NBRC 101777) TaxID=1042311 RepID=A0A2T3ZMK3_TRIA4|nr:hypothetical protein M441DRAFT_207820 [Trichoderma asperellum CBS 433.97]PTB46012.1 hypothetical protein M441DRAFT_207820 [Trichoderma asperellum CBS 433.97]
MHGKEERRSMPMRGPVSDAIQRSKWWLAALFEDTSQLPGGKKKKKKQKSSGERPAAMIRRGLSKSAGMMAASLSLSLSLSFFFFFFFFQLWGPKLTWSLCLCLLDPFAILESNLLRWYSTSATATTYYNAPECCSYSSGVTAKH